MEDNDDWKLFILESRRSSARTYHLWVEDNILQQKIIFESRIMFCNKILSLHQGRCSIAWHYLWVEDNVQLDKLIIESNTLFCIIFHWATRYRYVLLSLSPEEFSGTPLSSGWGYWIKSISSSLTSWFVLAKFFKVGVSLKVIEAYFCPITYPWVEYMLKIICFSSLQYFDLFLKYVHVFPKFVRVLCLKVGKWTMMVWTTSGL